MTEKQYIFSQKYLCHAVFAKFILSLFFSENNLCKVDVISVKNGCMMTKGKYGFSHFCHTTALLT